jgi:hypothetical protein
MVHTIGLVVSHDKLSCYADAFYGHLQKRYSSALAVVARSGSITRHGLHGSRSGVGKNPQA